MRFFLWLGVVFLALLLVLAPVVYGYEVNGVPRLEGTFDLDRALAHTVEEEQMVMQVGHPEREPVGKFHRPTLGKFPELIRAVYLTNLGCPSFFQTSRETVWQWRWRWLSTSVLGRAPLGNGRCEWILAEHLASSLRIQRAGSKAIAIHRIHSILERDQLLAYDLGTLGFEDGVRGVERASEVIFKKPLRSLRLDEMAELGLAMPPFDFYEEVKSCSNPTLLRQDRDILLQRLSAAGLVSEEQTAAAQAQALSCTTR